MEIQTVRHKKPINEMLVGSLLDEDCDGVRCCKAGGSWPTGGCNEKVVPSGDICLSTFHGVALVTFGS